MSSTANHESEIVKINIGGQRFWTTRATLLSKGENFFSGLLGGKFAQTRDDGIANQQLLNANCGRNYQKSTLFFKIDF